MGEKIDAVVKIFYPEKSFDDWCKGVLTIVVIEFFIAMVRWFLEILRYW